MPGYVSRIQNASRKTRYKTQVSQQMVAYSFLHSDPCNINNQDPIATNVTKHMHVYLYSHEAIKGSTVTIYHKEHIFYLQLKEQQNWSD